jgi:hypothetical protein
VTIAVPFKRNRSGAATAQERPEPRWSNRLQSARCPRIDRWAVVTSNRQTGKPREVCAEFEPATHGFSDSGRWITPTSQRLILPFLPFTWVILPASPCAATYPYIPADLHQNYTGPPRVANLTLAAAPAADRPKARYGVRLLHNVKTFAPNGSAQNIAWASRRHHHGDPREHPGSPVIRLGSGGQPASMRKEPGQHTYCI